MSSCAACRFMMAFIINLLFVLDITVNVLLLGRPPETLSLRFARLRAYGGPRYAWIGKTACAILTWIGNKLGAKRDHCDWTLDSTNAGTDGTEIWRWSK